MELYNVLNELEELIEISPKVPFTRRVLVDEERLLDYVDRVRTSLPEEIRQAKWVLQEREKVLADTKKEANRLLEDAQKRMEQHVDESELVSKARATAEEIVRRAEATAREIKLGALNYAEDVLNKLTEELDKINDQVQKGKEELKTVKDR